MKKSILAITIAALLSLNAFAAKETPISKFYEGYNVSEIPADGFQQWPYYNYASMNIEGFLAYGVYEMKATNPVDVKYDLDSYSISDKVRTDLLETQVKGFMVMKDGVVLEEYYDNGFNRGMLNNLQSASKTYVGVLLGKAIDEGLIGLNTKAKVYLPALKGSIIGEATISEIATMNSGIEPLHNYHTKGSNGYEWEKEIGLQPAGKPIGHLNAIKAAKASPNPKGTNWDYTDQNTDTLGLILAKVRNKPFQKLLGELHAEIGGHDKIQIGKTSDGTTSPSYGINTSLIDYSLFAQYIAQGKAGKTFYAELKDTKNDVLRKTPGAGDGFSVAGDMTYDMQSYTINSENIILSHGSFGQTSFSDTESGISVVYLSDWSTNTEIKKLGKQITNAVNIINEIRNK